MVLGFDLGKITEQLRAAIRSELQACIGHLQPPRHARPVAWSLALSAQNSSSGIVRAGVRWTPALEASGKMSNAYTTATDTATPEAWPVGVRGVLWCSVFAARDDSSTANVSSRPMSEVRHTWSVDQQPLPGYQRQLCSGFSTGHTLNSAETVQVGSAGTGMVDFASKVPVILSPGQTLSVAIDCSAIAASTSAIVVAQVRGWMYAD